MVKFGLMEARILGYNLRGQITHVFANLHELENYFEKSIKFFNSIEIESTKFYYEEEFKKLSNSKIDQHKIVAQVIGEKRINIESLASNYLERIYKTEGLSSLQILLMLNTKETAFAENFGYPQTKTTSMEEDKLGGKDGGKYSATGSSAHYKQAVLEYVDKQERCYGTFLAYSLCFMQIDKYRDRAGLKEGVSIEKDMVKAIWYTKCAEFLLEKIQLHNSGELSKKSVEFDQKYGFGRSIFIHMPSNLNVMYQSSLGNSDFLPLKGLGEIVDNKLKA
jgi:hypothetical protein